MAPKGHFVVYANAGKELKRFVLPISYLKTPLLQLLLEKAADEYGFTAHDGIVLPCDASIFQKLKKTLCNTQDRVKHAMARHAQEEH
ncbi:Small auxin-up RNA [Dillenia turbinata]|uniref:Small auxin-up RNA n=1 Tax=Dillenia turbinata TaxID=194707 RepID=A0AAN8UUD8_9MAGN